MIFKLSNFYIHHVLPKGRRDSVWIFSQWCCSGFTWDLKEHLGASERVEHWKVGGDCVPAPGSVSRQSSHTVHQHHCRSHWGSHSSGFQPRWEVLCRHKCAHTACMPCVCVVCVRACVCTCVSLIVYISVYCIHVWHWIPAWYSEKNCLYCMYIAECTFSVCCQQ